MYGIGGDLLELLRNYLTDRIQRVTLGGVESSWLGVTAGVPQGSVLGPLLFLIFINDIEYNIQNQIRLFADDTTIFMASPAIANDSHYLQSDINTIYDWSRDWCVNYNPSKTELLLVSRKREPTDIVLTLNTVNITKVPHHKHLGLIFEQNGSWKTNTGEIVAKAHQRVGTLKNIKFLINRKSLETLYNSYVRPLMEYGDIVWDGIPNIFADRLEKIQIECLRIITGITVSSSLDQLYIESGFPTLSIRRKFHRLIMYYKIINNEAPQYLSDLMPMRSTEHNPYNVRRADDFINFRCHTVAYSNSFFPATTKDWNELPTDIRQATTIGSFKYKLKKHLYPNNPPPWFYAGDRIGNIHHCRLRNGCSGLKYHLFINHISPDPKCKHCQLDIDETPTHFLLDCPFFIVPRNQLVHELQEHFHPPRILPFSTDIFLRGSSDLSVVDNTHIVKTVQRFIIRTKRFSS